MLKIRIENPKYLDFRVLVLLTTTIILVSIVSAQSFTESGGQVSATTQDYSVATEGARSGTDWLELNGSVSGLSDLNDSIRFGFEYREVGSSTWNEVFGEALESSGDFQRRVEGLNPDTEYEFRAVSLEHDRNGSVLTKFTLPGVFTKSGGQVSFSTQDYSVSTGTATSGTDWLELNGSVSGLSELNDSVRFGFEYRQVGSSTWNGVFGEALGSSGSFYRRVEGLNPDTNYEYRASGLEHDRNGSVKTKLTLPGVFTKSGGSVSFQTKDYSINTTEAVSGTDWLSFRGELSNINSELQEPISLSFEYRKTGASTWNLADAGTRTNNGFFERRVEGLENGTEYEFRAYSEHGKQGSILQKNTLPGVFSISGGVVSFATGPALNVSIDSINTPVFAGDEVKVDAMIQNTGAEGVATVDLNISGLGSDSTSLNLSSGQTVIKTFNVSTTSSDIGEYTANISSASDSDIQAFNVSELRAPIDPRPVSGTDPVGLDWDLSAVANGTGGFDRTINFYVKNNSNNLSAGSGLVSPGERVNASLSSLDLDTGTTYEWFAESEYSGITNKSQDWNFTTVERPEVLSIEPGDGSGGIDNNPTLNVTVNGSAEVKVEFYNDAGDVLFHSENVSSSGTASYDLSSYADLGDGLTEYWYVSLESMGVQWNNSENPYRFSISNVSEVNYDTVKLQNNDNLNPGNFNGLDVVGPSKIEFEAWNPQGADMDIGLNISNSTDSEEIIRSDIGNNSVATFDVKSSTAQNIVEENNGYDVQAFYQEGTTKYTASNFTSADYSISTNVAKLNWTDGSPSRTEEFRIYFNESDQAFNTFSQVGSVNADSTDMEAGVANRGLDSDGSDDCYAVRAWAPVGGLSDYSTTDSHCIGGVDP